MISPQAKQGLAVCLCLLSGCLKETAIDRQAVIESENWQAESSVISLESPQPWLEDLESPRLEVLVKQALAGNPVLMAAESRWRIAQAQRDISGAPLKPRFEAGAEVGRQRLNQFTRDRFGLNITASWEADVWGRLSNTARAAIEDEKAFAADYRAARLSLAANVARTWFAIIEVDLQERLAGKTAEIFRKSEQVIEERYRRGLNSALDVRLARTDVATAENEITRRQREKDGLIRKLDVLLGRYPVGHLKIPDYLPPIKQRVPAGLPSQLLARRPDLVAAEHRLTAAGERLQAARKNRLPSIRLTTSGGLASSELGQLLDWDSLVWSLLAGITQPIFEGGRLDAEQALAEARHGEAWANYAQAVLVAFKEVETALAAEDHYTRQAEQLYQATQEASQAAELALEQYQNGLIDIITLLQAQRRAFETERNLIRIRRERLDNRIALYLALGGDFSPIQAESTGKGKQNP